ncbi:MAG: helix-turn-helix domain-containing protein [Spirochaetaceae bacterium]|jgi:excisionase family DNA binding protein|nr:helix-turn-helix domain-containing protein [Spirochaetaceae bacterium]
MEKLLSKKEVAEMLGLSIYTIDKWVSLKQKLPYIRLGRRVLFQLSDVEEYLITQRVEPLGKCIGDKQ